MADSVGISKAKEIIENRKLELVHSLNLMYIKDIDGYLNYHHSINGESYAYYSENPQSDTMYIESAQMEYTDLLDIMQFYVEVSNKDSVDFLSAESENDIKELSKGLESFAPNPEEGEE